MTKRIIFLIITFIIISMINTVYATEARIGEIKLDESIILSEEITRETAVVMLSEKDEFNLFVEEYDISATEEDNVIATLYSSDRDYDYSTHYKIIISGTGNMKDFDKEAVPWEEYCGDRDLNLKKVIIEDGVKNIGNNAFDLQYGLEKLELANTITKIGDRAFTYCDITELNLSDNIVSIGKDAFLSCSELSNLRLPEGLKEISDSAFRDTAIKELNIPMSVKTIGYKGFYFCTKLKELYIPEGVETIEGSAFAGCGELERVEIASGVTSIGTLVFDGCKNLVKITIPSNVKTIGSTTGDSWDIVNDSENITVYFKSGSEAEKYFAAYDKKCVVDDNNPIINNVHISETDWTNQDVTITVTAIDELSGLSKYAYSFDGGETWQAENFKTYSEYTEGIVIKVKDCLYNTVEYEEKITVYIDKVNPIIDSVEISETEWTNQDVTITVNATDDLSGFGTESYSFDGGKTWQAENSKTYQQNINGIEIQIKDKAGNITKYNKIINIGNIDKVNPIINNVLGEKGACLSTVLTIDATDDLSGFGAKTYSFDNGITWQESNYKEYNESKANVIIKVKDKAGNIATYTENINITIGHIEVIDSAVEVTCTQKGLTEGKHCSRCNEILIAQQEISALGHIEVIDQGVAATCATEGITEGKHCSRCNEILVAQEKIEALGHNYQIKYKDNAVCEQGGKIVYECARCLHTYEETIQATGHTEAVDQGIAATCTETGLTQGKHCSVCNEVLVEQTEIPALGHLYSQEWTEDVSPTCTMLGSKSHHCTREHCESKKDITEVPMIGHTYGEWVIDRESTYEEEGHKYRVCTMCNEEREEQNIPVLEKIEIATTYTEKEQDNVKYIMINVNTTVSDLFENITSNKEIKVIDRAEKELKVGDLVGTGAKVVLKENNQDVYIVVLQGDVNCDGKITFNDIIRTNAIRINQSENQISKAELFAADIDNTNKIEFRDIIKINAIRINSL